MKHNYLNNKDILKEIHKSKTTYCTFTDAQYADYDMILPDFKSLNKKNILQGRKNRAERLAKLALEEAVAKGEKRKLEEFEIKYTKIPETDVIFRVMSWEHIQAGLGTHRDFRVYSSSFPLVLPSCNH